MAEPQLTTLFVQLSLVLVVARLLGRVAARSGLAPVVGELLTGLVLGASLFGTLAPGLYAAAFPLGGETLAPFAAVGLVLLLVLAGVETDLAFVRRRAVGAVAVTAGGIALPFALGFAFTWVLPASYLAAADRLVVGLFLATALSVSAVPVIARILDDLEATGTDVGQLILASAMLTDVVGWLLVALIAGVYRTGTAAVSGLATSVLLLAGFVLAAATVGRRLLDALLRRADAADTPTLSAFSVVVVAAFVGVSIALAIGVESGVGAFVVGLVVGQSDRLDQVAVRTLERVTLGLFAPLFFGSAGLVADLAGVVEPGAALVTAGLFAIAVVGKLAGAYAGGAVAGLSRWESFCLGAGLNARGAVEIVIAAIGLSLGILSPALYTGVVLVAILTSIMAAPLLRWGLRRVAEDIE